MNIQYVVFGLWNIIHLFQLFNLSSSFEDSYTNYLDLQPLVFEYKRLAEIESHCSKILSSGSKLMLNDAKVERIMNELSFYNGDWEQVNNGLSPLMPFDRTDLPTETDLASLRLINFEVRDVKSLDDMQNGVGLGGVISIGITRSKSFSADHRSKFSMNPGMSVLTIVFEGVYVETEENAGERLLCLLGNTTLPSRRWLLDWSLENICPNLVQDDQLMVVLKYPKISNLTARAIQGELISMHESKSFKFFDKVLISSQVGWFSDYQFSPSQSSSCNTSVHQEQLDVNRFSGSDFCKMFRGMSDEVFNVLPDLYTDDSLTDNGKLGPFVVEKEVLLIDRNYNNVKLMIQKAKCKKDGKTSNAKVSAVFRVVPTQANSATASSRSGFSGMTLLAEGTWDASTGRLCMVGSVPKGKTANVIMYFPRVLTIRQRSIVFGSIEGSFSPLQLNFLQGPSQLESRYGWYSGSYLSYNYTKIKKADESRRRSQSFISIIRFSQQSVLRYPTIEETGGFFSLSQIYDLTDELYIDREVAYVPGVSIRLEVLSVGSYIARYDFLYKSSNVGILADAVTLFSSDGLLNVSVLLTVFEEPLASSSTRDRSATSMFAEGLYDPHTGMMYLIGCGFANPGVHVEGGLDCSMETKVQYPPQNFRWLRDPTVEIIAKSQRNSDDPLYFLPMNIKSKTITRDIFKHNDHEGDVAFRKIFEGVLQITVLLLEIAIIWSQKLYMDLNIGLASSVSPNIFALQIISYSIVLIIGKVILFSSKEDVFYLPYDLLAYQPMLKGLDYAIKLLAFTALFLATRLFCNVTKSRKKLNEEEPSNTSLTFKDMHYFLFLLRGFVIVYLVSLAIVMLSPLHERRHIMEILQILLVDQLMILGSCSRNLPLLAYIFGCWHRKNQVKSLRKIYYIGLPLLQIVLKAYDHIRSPISDPYIAREPEDFNLLNVDTLVLLSQVITVHVLQNFNYFWLIECLKVFHPRRLKHLLFRSRHRLLTAGDEEIPQF